MNMPHRVVFLIFPGFQLLDVAGPLAAFEVAECLRPGSYTWRIAAAQAGSVLSSAGMAWVAHGLPRVGSFDTLMAAGGDGVDAACADARTVRWLQRAAASAKGKTRIASVCSGSLLLAEAGMLDGRAATTHWCRTRQFRQRFPAVHLQEDRIFVKDGRIWTSAGITAGIDLALALIGQDLGEEIAHQVARQLVVYHRRPGGQSQFSQLLEMEHASQRFAALLDHVRGHLALRHSVEDLAARACMSPRHFARAFAAETGVTPARAVERLRAEAARAQLESGAASVARVAQACGFGNAERMRRSFLRLFGAPPAAVKRARARRGSGA